MKKHIVMLFPQNSYNEESFQINQLEDFDEFVERIFDTITTRSIVPFDVWLIYDDEKMYKNVLKKLRCRKKSI